MLSQNVKLALLAGAIAVASIADNGHAQQHPRPRVHTATKAESLSLVIAGQRLRGSEVRITVKGASRIIQSNGVPDHAVGKFPNRGNPHQISAQRYTFRVPANPKVRRATELARGASFGVAMNGVPFDPNAAEFWQGRRSSGWTYNALGGAVPLGLDTNYAHVQPSGAYHYHGLPVKLMQALGWNAKTASPLIGYAADGFPIYALTAEVNGQVTKMTSSWRLKAGRRPGGSEPDGRFDGTFVQDYAFVAGAGNLDRCNGAIVQTIDFPNETYAYFLTKTYPVVPRCVMGDIGTGFSKR